MTCCRYVVSGRVQGVFFRASTRQQAQELGLTGWVRNAADGSVELLACGDERALKELEAWLWRGPQLAEVSEVTVFAGGAGAQGYADFAIRY
jgi:acylphosphatase